MRLTREQFEKRTKDYEEKNEWIIKDRFENKQKYKKEEFVESCEKNIKIFSDCGLPYELILQVFRYCDISTCVKFGIWEQAIFLARNIRITENPTDFDCVQFFHYFESDTRIIYDVCPYMCDLETIKFLYYNHKLYVINELKNIAYYKVDIKIVEFLMSVCNSNTSNIRRISKKYNKELYDYVYNNPTPVDLELRCHAKKKNGSPCLNKASHFGYCGIHRKSRQCF